MQRSFPLCAAANGADPRGMLQKLLVKQTKNNN